MIDLIKTARISFYILFFMMILFVVYDASCGSYINVILVLIVGLPVLLYFAKKGKIINF